jgi:hypothetical protein
MAKGNAGWIKTRHKSEKRDFSNMLSTRYLSNFEEIFLCLVMVIRTKKNADFAVKK